MREAVEPQRAAVGQLAQPVGRAGRDAHDLRTGWAADTQAGAAGR